MLKPMPCHVVTMITDTRAAVPFDCQSIVGQPDARQHLVDDPDRMRVEQPQEDDARRHPGHHDGHVDQRAERASGRASPGSAAGRCRGRRRMPSGTEITREGNGVHQRAPERGVGEDLRVVVDAEEAHGTEAAVAMQADPPGQHQRDEQEAVNTSECGRGEHHARPGLGAPGRRRRPARGAAEATEPRCPGRLDTACRRGGIPCECHGESGLGRKAPWTRVVECLDRVDTVDAAGSDRY